MEDLEFNPFYRALQTQFQALFDRAQDECWLVCIPCSSSLPSKAQITHSFVEAHLLEPSRMLRDEYNTLVGSKRIPWKLQDNNTLVCPDNGLKVKVLAEELAYNRKYNQYKMFVVDAPLLEVEKSRQHKEGKKGDSDSIKQVLLTPRRTLAEHLEVLQYFTRHREILSEINKRLHMFNNNYLILEDFLSDASHRLETLLKSGYSSYVTEHSTYEIVHDRRIQETIWLAVEIQMMNEVHSKVHPVIRSKYRSEDDQFYELSCQLRPCFTPPTLSISSDYHCKYPVTLSVLAKLKDCRLPLEKLYCLQDAIDSIYVDVHEHFKARLRVGDPTMLQSDDLIPLLATIIVQAGLKTFVSDVTYIELFHWSPSDSSKLSYVLVTVRASLEYIRGKEVQKYLPPKPTSRSSRPSSVSSEGSHTHSSFDVHNQDSASTLSQTLSKLVDLQLKADKIEKKQKAKPTGLGPFFDNLEDGVVSSQSSQRHRYRN